MKRRTSIAGNRHVVATQPPPVNLDTKYVLMHTLYTSEDELLEGSAGAASAVDAMPPRPGVDESARALAEALTRSIEADVKSFVARELHDQVVQTLTTTLLDMERFKAEQFGRSGVQNELALLQDAIRGALNQIRNLLYDLRDQPSADTDFVESVQEGLIAVFERRTGIKVTLSVAPAWPAVLSPRAAMNLHRAIQEALNNVMLHAGAGAVHIKLEVNPDGEAVVAIEDDGHGLVERPRDGGPQGLLGMTERAVLLGGKLSISSEPGKGTTVRLMVPATGLA
jgi:signal transduction histidine kinase